MSITHDSTDTQTHRFKIISLDVWGHGPDEHEKYDCDGECEGYTVNNAFHTGRTIEVIATKAIFNVGTPHEYCAYHAEDAAIVRALVEAGELNEKALVDGVIKIDGEDDYTLYVEDSDGCPLLHLERVTE